ncbi:kinase-like domain-containing protein [Phaeosphaeria sp. MPI-PUGE-AT-0046c]|nr:kinase-like domain-containing protein [Phaeosphaeria sp. MPI-PUGE-AT-0046c]
MAPYDIAFRPEDLMPNVVFSPEGGTLSEDDAKRLGKADRSLGGSPELLCRACGWTTYHELCSSYLPRLRMYHVRPNSGLWQMGNDWLIWDRPGDRGIETNDYMTYKFLRDQGTNIPLVEKMYQFGKEGDEFQFTVMSRAKGETLENVWPKLTLEEKRSCADQIIATLRELRQFTAPSPQRVDGSPLWDNIIGQCSPLKICRTIPETKEKWLNGIDEELRIGIGKQLDATENPKPSAESLYEDIRTTFPDSAPFVLTHADLNMGNIIVHDGKILAIIDWELAGYYPWWVERWASYQRAVSGNAYELFHMVWAEVSPELPLHEFVEKTYRPVKKAANAYSFAPIKHTQSHDVWLRPGWCECKPHAGKCCGKDWGAELKHEIDYNHHKRRAGIPKKKFDREVVLKEDVTPGGDEPQDERLEKVHL